MFKFDRIDYSCNDGEVDEFYFVNSEGDIVSFYYSPYGILSTFTMKRDESLELYPPKFALLQDLFAWCKERLEQ